MNYLEELKSLGHFDNPSMPTGITTTKGLDLESQEARTAIKSYQLMNIGIMEELTALHYGHVNPIVDGVIGPITKRVFSVERCGYPDYVTAEASGSGSWKHSCEEPGIHTITIKVNKSRMPRKLEGLFEEDIWPDVAEAYAQIGVKLVRVSSNENLSMSWEALRGSTIGLAIVPGGPMGCDDNIWLKLDPTYLPANLSNQIKLLLAHEAGHNLRLQHTSGGIMNPSIAQIKFHKDIWLTDPSFNILKRYFGGESINDPEPTPDPVPPSDPTSRLILRGTLKAELDGVHLGNYIVQPAREI